MLILVAEVVFKPVDYVSLGFYLLELVHTEEFLSAPTIDQILLELQLIRDALLEYEVEMGVCITY